MLWKYILLLEVGAFGTVSIFTKLHFYLINISTLFRFVLSSVTYVCLANFSHDLADIAHNRFNNFGLWDLHVVSKFHGYSTHWKIKILFLQDFMD